MPVRTIRSGDTVSGSVNNNITNIFSAVEVYDKMCLSNGMLIYLVMCNRLITCGFLNDGTKSEDHSWYGSVLVKVISLDHGDACFVLATHDDIMT